MEEKRTAGHPIDPRVEWFAFGNALDFSLTLKPNSIVPYKGIPLGADIVARFRLQDDAPGRRALYDVKHAAYYYYYYYYYYYWD
jgi:hypothetical protein